MPCELKNHCFEVSSSLILRNNIKSFLDRIVTCDEKWILWDNWQQPAQKLKQEDPKHFPKQICTKKVHGHCLMVCYWSDPLQLSESQLNYYIWEICSANRWDSLKTTMPAAGIGQQKGSSYSPQQCPTSFHTTYTSKVESIGLQSYASATISPDLSLMGYHFFKHLDNFLQGKCFHIGRKQKMLTESSSNLKTQIFCYKNKQTYFLLAKICWL